MTELDFFERIKKTIVPVSSEPIPIPCRIEEEPNIFCRRYIIKHDNICFDKTRRMNEINDKNETMCRHFESEMELWKNQSLIEHIENCFQWRFEKKTIEIIKKEMIDGATFIDMNDEDWKQIGINCLIERTCLLSIYKK